MKAPNRPPDRVEYTEWEPIYGNERTRMIATDIRGVLFRHVEEYTEVVDQPVTGYRRKRIEIWEEPSRLVPVEVSSSDSDLVFEAKHEAPQTIARSEWEYRGPLLS